MFLPPTTSQPIWVILSDLSIINGNSYRNGIKRYKKEAQKIGGWIRGCLKPENIKSGIFLPSAAGWASPFLYTPSGYVLHASSMG
jgi:hypothetical protein